MPFLLVCFSERNGTGTVLLAVLAMILASINDSVSRTGLQYVVWGHWTENTGTDTASGQGAVPVGLAKRGEERVTCVCPRVSGRGASPRFQDVLLWR